MTPPPYPRATYRLQLNEGFTFRDAERLIPYLAEMGISHLYASPFLMARPGSQHGYDIVDHTRINPEIGSDADLDALTSALLRHGMGLILDFVPNHMGVMGADNGWWLDVLEWGEASPYASFFDIDWQPVEESLRGKVLLPILGDHYGVVLEGGGLPLCFDAERGTFSVWYHEHRLPIAVRHYAEILERTGVEPLRELAKRFASIPAGGSTASEHAVKREQAQAATAELARLAAASPETAAGIETALASYNGKADDPASFRDLSDLLDRQAYRVAYWRVAAHEINYRRFFDVTTLAGIRLEQPELFEIVHQRVFHLASEGKLQGIRLDHIDGLWDPAAYCRQLQERLAHIRLNLPDAPPRREAGPTAHLDRPFYVIVEKILAGHERLRREWPISGTTGYEFITLANGLFVDPGSERFLTRFYQRATGRSGSWDETVRESKQQIMRDSLASELNVVATQFARIAKQSRISRDYSLFAFRRALTDIAACFPVYRTYVTEAGADSLDRRDIEWAVGRARKMSRNPDKSIYDFVQSILTLDLLAQTERRYRREDVVRAAMMWQQFTAPVMAKSAEDTAFYRWVRLLSLNEVGGEPNRYGVAPETFHRANEERLASYPFSMLTLTTHDHKRGADVRARLNVISERPQLWARNVHHWNLLNGGRRSDDAAPRANDEYLFYQTLVGTWPFGIQGADWDAFTQRLVDYMLKAVREAKSVTAWTAPDADYEAAIEQFVRRAMSHHDSPTFLAEVAAFVEEIGPAAAVNGLAQQALLLTSPGVPDCFQGCEFWDLSLVDPDNRRPVDFEMRTRAARETKDGDISALLESWKDGRVKQAMTERILRHRKRSPDLFARGRYLPLTAEGRQAERVIAFARLDSEDLLLTVVPRLVCPLLRDASLPLPHRWEGTLLHIPDDARRPLQDLLTGRTFQPAAALKVEDVLETFPVAILTAAG